MLTRACIARRQCLSPSALVREFYNSASVYSHRCVFTRVDENSNCERWQCLHNVNPCYSIPYRSRRFESNAISLVTAVLQFNEGTAVGQYLSALPITFLQLLPLLPLWTDSRAMLGSMTRRQKWRLSHHAHVTCTTVRRGACMPTCNVAPTLECWHVHAQHGASAWYRARWSENCTTVPLCTHLVAHQHELMIIQTVGGADTERKTIAQFDEQSLHRTLKLHCAPGVRVF